MLRAHSKEASNTTLDHSRHPSAMLISKPVSPDPGFRQPVLDTAELASNGKQAVVSDSKEACPDCGARGMETRVIGEGGCDNCGERKRRHSLRTRRQVSADTVNSTTSKRMEGIEAGCRVG